MCEEKTSILELIFLPKNCAKSHKLVFYWIRFLKVQVMFSSDRSFWSESIGILIGIPNEFWPKFYHFSSLFCVCVFELWTMKTMKIPIKSHVSNWLMCHDSRVKVKMSSQWEWDCDPCIQNYNHNWLWRISCLYSFETTNLKWISSRVIVQFIIRPSIGLCCLSRRMNRCSIKHLLLVIWACWARVKMCRRHPFHVCSVIFKSESHH